MPHAVLRAVVVLAVTATRVAGQVDPATQPRSAAAAPSSFDFERELAAAVTFLREARYAEARRQVRAVLDRRDLTRVQRVRTLYTAAAVYFPPNAGARVPDSTKALLEELARRAVCTGLPGDDLWVPDLDAIYQQADAAVFALDAIPPAGAEIVLHGREAMLIQVCTNRRATVVLVLDDETRARGSLVLDAAREVRRPVLRATFVRGDTLVVPGGEYLLRVRASSGAASEERQFRIAVATAPLPADTLIGPLVDRLRPECTIPNRNAIRATGFVAGTVASIVPMLALFRGYANRPYRSSAALAGVAMFGGGLLAARIDSATVIPSNVRANDRALTDYRRARESQIGAHSTTVRVFEELRRGTGAQGLPEDGSKREIDAPAATAAAGSERASLDSLRPARCRAAASFRQRAERTRWTGRLWPQVGLTGAYAAPDFRGEVVRTGQRSGSIFDGGLDWGWIAANVNTRYEGESEHLVVDASIGPPALRLVGGWGGWQSIVTYNVAGSDEANSPIWQYLRIGGRTRLPLGASGILADVRVIRFRRMRPDIDVAHPDAPLGPPVKPRAVGGEVEAALEYRVPRSPFFLRAGHRVEVLEIDIGDYRATEAVNTLFVGGGLRTSLRSLVRR